MDKINYMPYSKMILLAHGSRDPRWRMPFECLLSKLREDLGAEKLDLAYMEFCSPSIEDVIASSYKDGRRKLKILPLFMAGGAHLRNDVPKILDEMISKYEDMTFEMLDPIGEHELVANAIQQIIFDEIKVKIS